MPKVNPIKMFAYSIEVDGLNAFLCQSAEIPAIEVEEVEHTEGNLKVKTPGLVTVGDVTLSNLRPTDDTDDFSLEWINAVQNPETGVGGVPSEYLRTVVIRLRDNGGNTVEAYELIDCWCKKALGLSLDKTSSDNVMEEVVLSCRRASKIQ